MDKFADKDNSAGYERTNMKKEIIIERLKEKGYRITKQRLAVIDTILETECSSCKDIYYNAAKINDKIGTATVYRMVNTLEEIGAINRKNMYKVECEDKRESVCTVIFEDNTKCDLSSKMWYTVIKEGLAACGYNKKIETIKVSG
ncbi:MAG: transcriptional repressor [Firmicutes bacterium]|nr:transcriptional repressor [Bacillota bacterium]